MKLSDFKLERYFARHEFKTPYLLGCSDCEAVSVKDIFELEDNLTGPFFSLKLGYTESSGDPVLRTEIAGLYENTDAENVLVHSGAEEAIFIFMNAMLDTGDHVIVQHPCYQSLYEVASSIGCDVSPWYGDEKNGWAPDIEALKKLIRPNTRVLVINFPHNPTGFLPSRDEWDEIIRLSRKNGFIIFSDEVYRFLEYDENDRLPALCDIDNRGVSLGVMSKAFGLAGLRIGWIATRNKNIFQRMAAFKDYTTICASAPSEFLAAVALRNHHRLVERNLSIIRANLKILDDFFLKHENLFHWKTPKAGPIAFPSLSDNRDADRFCKDLREQNGVLLIPGTLFGGYQNHFRIGFGRKNLPDCIRQFETFIERT